MRGGRIGNRGHQLLDRGGSAHIKKLDGEVRGAYQALRGSQDFRSGYLRDRALRGLLDVKCFRPSLFCYLEGGVLLEQDWILVSLAF